MFTGCFWDRFNFDLLVIAITQWYLILKSHFYLQNKFTSWYHHFAIMKSQNEQLHGIGIQSLIDEYPFYERENKEK